MTIQAATYHTLPATARPRAAAARGFTLIELMITCVIIAILAAVAIPSYSRYVVSSNRAAAQGEMMTIANKQEQYLLNNRNYGSADALGYTLPAGVASKYAYTMSVGTGTVPTYTITFTPSGSQAGDGTLSLDSAGTKLPAGKWK